MKPSHSPNREARFTCQVIRFWSGVCREDAPPSHHLESCEGCRHFFVSTEQLQLNLRHGARLRSAPPPGIEDRIIEALDKFNPPTPRRYPRRSMMLSLAGCMAVLGVLATWQLNLLPFHGRDTGTPVDYTAEVAALVAAMRSVPADLRLNFEAPTAQLVQDNSLGREVENVYSDARSALDFLAANFLPASPPVSSTERGTGELPRQS